MAWLAHISDIINSWGPVGWGGIGIASGASIYIATTLGYWLYASAKSRRMAARFQERVLSTALINPLARTFTNQRIKVHDLCPPIGGAIRDKVFVDCEIVGPANVLFLSCNLSNNGGEGVDGSITKNGVLPKNGVAFINCSFSGCKFYLMTFMVPEELYYSFSLYNWTGINWLTSVPEPLLPFNQAVTPELQSPQGTEPETPQ